MGETLINKQLQFTTIIMAKPATKDNGSFQRRKTIRDRKSTRENNRNGNPIWDEIISDYISDLDATSKCSDLDATDLHETFDNAQLQ